MKLVTQGPVPEQARYGASKTNVKYLFILILVAIVAGAMMAGVFKLMKCPYFWPSLQSVQDETTDRQVYNNAESEIPVVDSIFPDSGSVGAAIEVRGENFSGFEGDLVAIIENIDGVSGVIYGERPGSADNLIKFTLKSFYCQIDNSYSGLACPDYLYVIPGIYKIYVRPWGVKSNEAIFTVKP